MVYREPAVLQGAPVRVAYGPFPGWGPLLACGLGLLVFGGLATADKLETQDVLCRAGQGCEIATTWFGRTRRVPVGTLTSVRIDEVPCPAAPHYDKKCGVLVLQDGPKQYRLINVTTADARTAASRLRRVLPPVSTDVVSVRLHKTERYAIGFGLLEILAGLGLIGMALARSGCFQVCIDAGRQTITLRRTVLGLSVGSRRFGVAEVRDARVDWRPEGGVVVLDTAAGPLAVVDKPRRGWNVHRHAAAKLRAAFECPRRSAEAELAIEHADNQHRPPRPTRSLPRALLVGIVGGALFAALLFSVMLNDGSPTWLAAIAAGALIGAHVSVAEDHLSYGK